MFHTGNSIKTNFDLAHAVLSECDKVQFDWHHRNFDARITYVQIRILHREQSMEAVVLNGVLVDSEQYWQEQLGERIISPKLSAKKRSLLTRCKDWTVTIYNYLNTHYQTTLTFEEFNRLYGAMFDDVCRKQVNFLKDRGVFDRPQEFPAKVAIASSFPPK